MATDSETERNWVGTGIADSGLAVAGGMPLGSRVYDYLREQLRSHVLRPGSTIQTSALAKTLGVSKTPLRDALMQLQAEGFLRILPQRGVVINTLDARELKELIQVLGGLESQAMMLAFHRLGQDELDRMTEINNRLIRLLPQGGSAYLEYNELNIAFHDVFMSACGNRLLIDQIRHLKERMYHFPDRDYGDRWRLVNTEEHKTIIQAISDGQAQYAADFMRDVHWSFDEVKPNIQKSVSMKKGLAHV